VSRYWHSLVKRDTEHESEVQQPSTFSVMFLSSLFTLNADLGVKRIPGRLDADL
jgi:hypothetical protein